MAITQNPIIGRASGRFGTAVFTTLFGQNILKTLPVQVRDPNSPAQQLVREKFLVAATFCKLIYSWVVLAFPSAAVGMSSFAHLLKSVVAATSGSLGSVTLNYQTALSGLVSLDANSEFGVSVIDNEVEIDGLAGWSKKTVSSGDVVDLLFVNVTTGEVATFVATVSVDLTLQTTFPAPITVATDDFIVYYSVRKYANSLAGHDVSGVLTVAA